MVRAAAWVLAALLAGCSHTPEADRPGSAASPAGCVQPSGQALWRAETAPVIDKRQGQDALDSGDSENGEGPKPCP